MEKRWLSLGSTVYYRKKSWSTRPKFSVEIHVELYFGYSRISPFLFTNRYWNRNNNEVGVLGIVKIGWILVILDQIPQNVGWMCRHNGADRYCYSWILNKTKSYKTIHNIFTATEQSQLWVVLHAKNRFASNVGVKDKITSTIIHNFVFICRYLSTLAFRKNSNDKLRFKYDSLKSTRQEEKLVECDWQVQRNSMKHRSLVPFRTPNPLKMNSHQAHVELFVTLSKKFCSYLQ